MNAEEVLAEFRRERREVAWAGERLERTPLVTRRSSADGRLHEVAAFGLDEGSADGAIRDEVGRARALGTGLEWKAFSFDLPPDLRERLGAAGFSVGAREAVVAYDLAEGLGAFAEGARFEVRRVDGEAALADFRRVAEAAFGRDYSLTTAQLAEALRTGSEGHGAYVAYEGGEPASVGRLYTHPESLFAGLYGGGTAPGFRGQGLYKAVVAARARDAARAGARYMQVDALPTSLPILLRLGFVRIADTWPCEWEVG